MTIAYMNVATDRQHLEAQREKIASFALAKGIKVDKWIMEVSGERARQPGPRLRRVTGRLREGDALIVADISRICLTLYKLTRVLIFCLEKKVVLYCLDDRYIFNDKLDRERMAEILKRVGEMDRCLASLRTKDGLERVRSVGKRLGRPKGSESKLFYLDAHKEEIRRMLERGETVAMVCERFKVSKNTYYKYKNKYPDAW